MSKAKKRKAGTIKRPQKVNRARVSLAPGRLTISYDHPHQILPALMDLSNHFVAQHFSAEPTAALLAAAAATLGMGRARAIVSDCAGSSRFDWTIDQIHLDPYEFRATVHARVDQAGFEIDINLIPATKETELEKVADAIEDATAK